MSAWPILGFRRKSNKTARRLDLEWILGSRVSVLSIQLCAPQRNILSLKVARRISKIFNWKHIWTSLTINDGLVIWNTYLKYVHISPLLIACYLFEWSCNILLFWSTRTVNDCTPINVHYKDIDAFLYQPWHNQVVVSTLLNCSMECCPLS